MRRDAPVVLLWGESPFLLRRAALRLLGDLRPTEIAGAEWRPGATADLATPSLLGEARALLVTEAEDLPAEGLEEVARYALEPDPEARLVLAITVSARAKGPPARMTKMLQGRVEIERVGIDRKELPDWVRRLAAERGIPTTPDGARALVETLGEEPGLLDQAVAQLAGAFPDEGVTAATVAAQFRGFGERRIWELCDAAFGGNGPQALRHLAAMLEAREQPLAILGGVAARLRDLIRVRALSPRIPPKEAARAARLRFDWQAKRYLQQARRFTEEDLAHLHDRVVDADRMLKVGARGDVILPMLVARIAGPS